MILIMELVEHLTLKFIEKFNYNLSLETQEGWCDCADIESAKVLVE